MVAAIQTAQYFDMDRRDVLFLPLTDSAQLYGSRVRELADEHGPYTAELAGRHFARYLEGTAPAHFRELSYVDRKALHNLKYFTWVEQQQRSVADLQRLWDPDFWTRAYAQVHDWDRRIEAFNELAGAEVGVKP